MPMPGKIAWVQSSNNEDKSSRWRDSRESQWHDRTFLWLPQESPYGKTVHDVEARYGFHRDDRAVRVVATVADQDIQGPGSIRFCEKERLVDNLPPDPLSEGICKFHISDGVGGAVDRAFLETITHHRLLRLVRRHFAWGTGKLIFSSNCSQVRKHGAQIRRNC